eukprot:scaffold44775_cov35-Prasinocladus_malaysianus.AAC.1
MALRLTTNIVPRRSIVRAILWLGRCCVSRAVRLWPLARRDAAFIISVVLDELWVDHQPNDLDALLALGHGGAGEEGGLHDAPDRKDEAAQKVKTPHPDVLGRIVRLRPKPLRLCRL